MTDLTDYKAFLENKLVRFAASGFNVSDDQLNPNLFDFQKHCVRTALRKGRYALFQDCGLGKTLQQLEWAGQIVLGFEGNIFDLTADEHSLLISLSSVINSFETEKEEGE